MKKLQGKITISRPRGGHEQPGEGRVSIRVEDEISGCVACEIEVPLVEFIEALFCGYRQCTISLNDSGVLGKKRELREIVVPRPPIGTGNSRSGRRNDETALKWIQKHAAHELTDGWEPHHPQDVFNSHLWTDGDMVRVGLIRFVPDTGEPTKGE